MIERKKLVDEAKIIYTELLSRINTNELMAICDVLEETKNKGNKTFIVGNGGSAGIASHFAVDLTKQGKVPCMCFNDSALITCFANDYGYENWVSACVKNYVNSGDTLILISSSGASKNMLNAAAEASKKSARIITLSGMTQDNPLSKLGQINIWVESKGYNSIENMHQIILLLVVDMLKGKLVYSA